MKRFLFILTLLCLVSLSHAAEKKDASSEGEKEAIAVVRKLEKELPSKSTEELIQSIVLRSGERRYGGYDYYFNTQFNLAIALELEKRGGKAADALLKHSQDKGLIYEPINGPGETVGRMCQRLLSKNKKNIEPGAAANGHLRRP